MFQSLVEKMSGAFAKFRNKGKLTEADVKAGMREIKLALLEADVNFKVVKEFVNRVSERAVGNEVLDEDGKPVEWVDVNGNTVTVMPECDIVLYPKGEFWVAPSEDINEDYLPGADYTLSANVSSTGNPSFTYQWYKDGKAMIASSTSANDLPSPFSPASSTVR